MHDIHLSYMHICMIKAISILNSVSTSSAYVHVPTCPCTCTRACAYDVAFVALDEFGAPSLAENARGREYLVQLHLT